jgi:hypothetical protein
MKTFRSALDAQFSATDPASLVTAPSRCAMRHKPSGIVIPRGTEFSILFGRVGEQWALRASAVVPAGGADETDSAHISIVTRKVHHFFTPPAIAELAGEEFHSGACQSVLGETVEPDGIDEHGSPSWLMALALV